MLENLSDQVSSMNETAKVLTEQMNRVQKANNFKSVKIKKCVQKFKKMKKERNDLLKYRNKCWGI